MPSQRKIHHIHLNTELESILLLPDGKGPFPAVLLFHEYTGLNETVINHAKRLAAFGYAVLAADFYGLRNRPSNTDEARSTHRIYRNDRLLMRKRARACLDVLYSHPEVDLSCIYALGFSFGGGAALELARTGVQLQGVASVYGYLDTSNPASSGDVKCPLLVIHIKDDPVVPEQHLRMFEKEAYSAEVDYELHLLDNARHGFINPEAECFDARLADEIWKKILNWLENGKPRHLNTGVL